MTNANHVTLGDAVNGNGSVTVTNNWDVNSYNFGIDITGGSITAGTVIAGTHEVRLIGRTGDVTLNGVLSSASTGDAFTLAASNGSIVNNVGTGLFIAIPRNN